MKLKLNDCIITSIEGGSVDVSLACPTCWGGEEWVDYWTNVKYLDTK